MKFGALQLIQRTWHVTINPCLCDESPDLPENQTEEQILQTEWSTFRKFITPFRDLLPGSTAQVRSTCRAPQTCDCKHETSKRTVITVGVSGVGTTTAVQRCALEWAEGKQYHHIHLVFVLTFCELSSLKHKLSLIELLQRYYPVLYLNKNNGGLDKNDVWFVLDGLDDYNLSLNNSCPIVTEQR